MSLRDPALPADPDPLERFFRDLPGPIDHMMVTL
jgi:hypothetical protein